MAFTQFRLSGAHKDDLRKVCAIPVADLDRAADNLETEKFTIRRGNIERTIRKVVAGEQGEALGRIIFGMAGTFRRTSLSASAALDRVARSLGDALKTNGEFSGWEQRRPVIQRILETKSVKLAAKALDISYDFERVYVAGRVLTSVRPVFDDSGEELLGTTVVQTLRIEYVSSDGDGASMSLALDAEDIERLKKECVRAQTKAETAKSRIEKDCNVEALIPGEEKNE